MDYATTASKTQVQLRSFLGIFSPHFSKPKLRFLGQMLYGVQAAQDVKLSCIGRTLEEPISMKKIEDRLSRNLDEAGMDSIIRECIAREGAGHVGKDTFILVDPTDIRKLYARKMEYLDRIRDGSTGDLGNGYWGCLAVAVEGGSRRITPLSMRLWSCQSPEFTSENDEILGVVGEISRWAKKRGVYVIDRGGDRGEIFKSLIGNDLNFVVRLVGNRNLLCKGKERLAQSLASSCRMRYIETVERETREGIKRYELSFGVLNVALPRHPGTPLRLVVVRGFGEEPMMLLTTLALTDSRKSLWQVVEGYLTRWRVEDTLRYIKQCYHLEDLRVLTYRRLKNMVAILLAAVYFASTWLGSRQRLEILTSHITHAAKRIYGVVEFFYYAISDGLARVFSKGRRWRDSIEEPETADSKQMCFDFDG